MATRPPKGSPLELIRAKDEIRRRMPGLYPHIKDMTDISTIDAAVKIFKGNRGALSQRTGLLNTTPVVKPEVTREPYKPSDKKIDYSDTSRERVLSSRRPTGGHLDTSTLTVEKVGSALDDEAKLAQQNANANVESYASSAPDTAAHTPSQTPMTDVQRAELQEARNHFKNRKPRAVKFYDAQDWRAWRIIKAYEKRLGQSKTRWETSPEYDIYDTQQRDYAEELNKYAKEKYGYGTTKYKQFMYDYSLDRGHINPKGNRGFSHQMDVTSNIGPEVRTINREHSARMSFREWLEGMQQADIEQVPRIRAETERRLMKLSSEVGEDTPLGRHIKYLRSLPKFKGLDPKFADNKFLDINMFDSNPTVGVFMRSMKEMIESGDIKDANEYERMRRFFLTAMDGNPEFDLQSFMRETGVVPREFREGLPEGGKPAVGWEEVVSGNKQAASQLGNRKKLMKLLSKHGVGTPAAIFALMGASGATYAADDSDDASYVDHLIDKMERYDAVSSQVGEQTILQGAESVGLGGFFGGIGDWYNRNMDQVPESTSKFVSQLLWEMGKDVVTEPLGLAVSAARTPVAPEENVSFREQQQEQYNQGLLKNNWT